MEELNSFEDKLNSLRQMKLALLDCRTSENKKDIRKWTRKIDKQIKQLLSNK